MGKRAMTISLEVEIKPETNDQLQQLIERHPTWSQNTVIQYAIEMFLKQHAGAV
jgi:hypothetical protein